MISEGGESHTYVPEPLRKRKERREQGRKPEILDAWVCGAIWAPWTKAIWSSTDCFMMLKLPGLLGFLSVPWGSLEI